MQVKKSQPIRTGKSLVVKSFASKLSLLGLSMFFTLGTFLTAQNKLFYKLTFSLLADTEPIQIQRRLIDFSKNWVAHLLLVSKGHAAQALSSFIYMIGLFDKPQTHRERNVELDSQQPFVGRSVTWWHKNGCVADLIFGGASQNDFLASICQLCPKFNVLCMVM